MVYIRKKKVKGIDYAYLVRSKWDPKNNTSRQEIVKYLGRTSSITIGDIPPEYREDSAIMAFISSYSKVDKAKNEILLKKMRQDLLK